MEVIQTLWNLVLHYWGLFKERVLKRCWGCGGSLGADPWTMNTVHGSHVICGDCTKLFDKIHDATHKKEIKDEPLGIY